MLLLIGRVSLHQQPVVPPLNYLGWHLHSKLEILGVNGPTQLLLIPFALGESRYCCTVVWMSALCLFRELSPRNILPQLPHLAMVIWPPSVWATGTAGIWLYGVGRDTGVADAVVKGAIASGTASVDSLNDSFSAAVSLCLYSCYFLLKPSISNWGNCCFFVSLKALQYFWKLSEMQFPKWSTWTPFWVNGANHDLGGPKRIQGLIKKCWIPWISLDHEFKYIIWKNNVIFFFKIKC